jgi:hypothetical protein
MKIPELLVCPICFEPIDDWFDLQYDEYKPILADAPPCGDPETCGEEET